MNNRIANLRSHREQDKGCVAFQRAKAGFEVVFKKLFKKPKRFLRGAFLVSNVRF